MFLYRVTVKYLEIIDDEWHWEILSDTLVFLETHCNKAIKFVKDGDDDFFSEIEDVEWVYSALLQTYEFNHDGTYYIISENEIKTPMVLCE